MLPHCRGLEAGAAVVWFGISPPDCSHKALCPLASSWNTDIPVRGNKCIHMNALMTQYRDLSTQLQSNLSNCSHKSKTKNIFFPVVLKLLSMYEHVQVEARFMSLHPGCYLFGLEPRWDPCVLLRGAAWVVVRDGVSLEVWHELRHHLLQLARHWTHGMLLSHTLAVHADLPVETRTALGFTLRTFFWFTAQGKADRMSNNLRYITGGFLWCFRC